MSKVIYQSETNKINNDGEVLETQVRKVTKIKNEPEYVKMYIKTVLTLVDLPKSMTSVLYLLLNNLTYANKDVGSVIHINIFVKQQIAEKLKISVDRVNHCISTLKKRNVIQRISQSTYMVNPDFFGKGNWEDIKKVKQIYINFANKKIKQIKS